MIKKHELIEGAYYIGTCRNTNIAQWFKGKFIHIGFNFHQPYVETIEYFGDVQHTGFDGFIPIERIDVDINKVLDERIVQDYKNSARRFYCNYNRNDMKNEVWKPIPEYEGLYYASNLGRIRKHDDDKIMKQNFIRDYLVVGLTGYDRKRKTHRVHRLVALTFKDDYGIDLVVNHINGVKTDNRETNLEWVKRSENSKHTFLSGNKIKKLSPENVSEIKKMIRNGHPQKDIALKFNVSRSTVSEINTGKKWTGID